MYVHIQMKDLTLPALIDTGASCSLCFRSELFHELQKEGGIRLIPLSGSISVANGNNAEIVGKCYPLVSIGSCSWKGKALLIKNLSYPAIIGWQFLQDMQATLDIANRKLFLQGTEIREVPESVKIFSIEAINLEQVTITDPDNLPDFPGESKDIDIVINHPTLEEEEKNSFLKFMSGWKEKFKTSPGVTASVKMTLWPDRSRPPIKQRYFPMSPRMQEIAAQEIDKLLEKGYIVPSESPWSSPAFLLPKKNKTWRLTVDYREINKICIKNAYPLPRIEDTLNRLKDAKFISNLDLQSGYHQIPMDPESQPLTAFSIQGKGHFEYKVMPFGLSTAPAIFQAAMEKVLSSVLHKHTLVYLDDIIIASRTLEDHVQHLQEVLQLLYTAGFVLNWSKCNF